MRLNYFDYFRAICILLIVTGHSFTPWVIDTLPEKIVQNLIGGGSTLFVFISGFFFHYVFYPKFNYIKFVIKKTKNVFLPYIVLSSLAFFVLVVIRDRPHPQLTCEIIGFTDYLILYFQYLWTGRVLLAYWYIPFIMVVFLMSPVFIKYIKLPLKYQLSIFFILLVVSIYVQKPAYNLSPIHSVIYFTPIYLLGILYSLNQKSISKFINDKSFLLGLLTLLLATSQALIDRDDSFYFIEIEILYSWLHIAIVQKIVMIFFLMSILQKINTKEIPILKYLASVSFALYFIHPWLIYLLGPIARIEYISHLSGIIIVPIKTTLVVCTSLIILKCCKKILGSKSRYIIGW